jgi:hypothetical protein
MVLFLGNGINLAVETILKQDDATFNGSKIISFIQNNSGCLNRCYNAIQPSLEGTENDSIQIIQKRLEIIFSFNRQFFP